MSSNYRVFILEDNATTRLVIAKSLESQGVSCVMATTLAEAEAYITDESISLFLLDVNLPDGLSTELVENLHQQRPMVPVLVMTGDQDHALISELFAAGVRDFIRKPIHPLLLTSKVKSYLQSFEIERALYEANEVYQRIAHEKEQEEELAHYVYDHILKMHSIKVSGLNVANYSSGRFCGDILVSAKSPNGNLIAMLADATGHGMAAALTIYPMVSTFSAMVTKGLSLGAILKELTSKHMQSIPQNRFVAAILLEISPTANTLKIWNGGMPSVLMFDHQGAIINRVSSQNMAIGILSEDMVSTKVDTFDLSSISALALFSDGLIENKVIDGQKVSFEDAYQIIADNLPDLDALLQLMHGYEDYSYISEDHDDMTLAYLNLEQISDELRSHAQEHVPVLGDFEFNFELAGSALNNEKFAFSLSELLSTYGFSKDFCQRVFTIVTELFLNSVDHGIFGIPSEVKEQDFIAYLSLRGAAQAEITLVSKVFINLKWSEMAQKLSIQLSDTGTGYEVENVVQVSDEVAYGRGLKLLDSLCDSFYYDQQTNTTYVGLEY